MSLAICFCALSCGKLAATLRSAKSHLTAVHRKTSAIPLCCHLCRYSTKSKVHIRRHVLKQHNFVGTEFACTVCGKTSKYRQSLQGHSASHTEERRYQCEKCGKKFMYSSTARSMNHACLPTVKRPTFACHICEHVCTQKTHLAEHILAHFGKELAQFACTICGKRDNTRVDSQRHLKRHFATRADV